MKRCFLYIFLVLIIINPKFVIAKGENESCDNRYVTLVNPVRGRELWVDKRLDPIKNQYNLIKQYNFPATWLLQYDVLVDTELLGEIKVFDENQEKGIFLEVSQKLADAARIIYPHSVPWFSPQAVFLSGYTQSERRKLIDRLFAQFKQNFGFYPKSVGAWWIDSYSLNYMKDKYDINSAMIVADQKTTDNYGVWGQWWGVPYYPAKANILTPASNLSDKLNVVIIQWAQRDPVLAIGDGPKFSNYSLQANDYIRQGKDTEYFKKLSGIYLDCENPIGQITVGLETGIEGVGYIDEYESQLKYLSIIPNIKIVTMNRFVERFSNIFPDFPKQFKINPNWILKTDSRENNDLGDYVTYQQQIAFKDFFVPDRDNFLDRNLEQLKKNNTFFAPWFLIVICVIGLSSLYKRFFKIWIIGTLFAFVSFGLILKSHYKLGWQVFYGPFVPYLILVQLFIVLFSYVLFWLFFERSSLKKNEIMLWFIPLSFGLDPFIQVLRFSSFGGKYYFGFAQDKLKFIGFSFSHPINLELINTDFPSYISAALLRFDFEKIWNNSYLSLLIYPLLHLVGGLLMGYLVIKLPNNVRNMVIILFIILTGLHLINIFQADPRLVQ